MKLSSLQYLACPTCHNELSFRVHSDRINPDHLTCPRCAKEYPVVEGIPYFIQMDEFKGQNLKNARLYNWLSWFYRAFSFAAFAYIGMSEGKTRHEMLDRLHPGGGNVLEISIGPGVNVPYLIHRSDVGEICGLDISIGQLKRCKSYIQRKDWDVDLLLGNAEELPIKDNMFSSVFHIGGINFFNDRVKAIEEMIRVAKPGACILICDENEKGVRAYERLIPGFRQLARNLPHAFMATVDLIPKDMGDVNVLNLWNGWMYCINFRKP